MAHEYPEHEKLSAIQDQSQQIGMFLDWLQETYPYESAELPRIQKLLAEYFEIDEDKLEEEKRLMLRTCRAHNNNERVRSRQPQPQSDG